MQTQAKQLERALTFFQTFTDVRTYGLQLNNYELRIHVYVEDVAKVVGTRRPDETSDLGGALHMRWALGDDVFIVAIADGLPEMTVDDQEDIEDAV